MRLALFTVLAHFGVIMAARAQGSVEVEAATQPATSKLPWARRHGTSDSQEKLES